MVGLSNVLTTLNQDLTVKTSKSSTSVDTSFNDFLSQIKKSPEAKSSPVSDSSNVNEETIQDLQGSNKNDESEIDLVSGKTESDAEVNAANEDKPAIETERVDSDESINETTNEEKVTLLLESIKKMTDLTDEDISAIFELMGVDIHVLTQNFSQEELSKIDFSVLSQVKQDLEMLQVAAVLGETIDGDLISDLKSDFETLFQSLKSIQGELESSAQSSKIDVAYEQLMTLLDELKGDVIESRSNSSSISDLIKQITIPKEVNAENVQQVATGQATTSELNEGVTLSISTETETNGNEANEEGTETFDKVLVTVSKELPVESNVNANQLDQLIIDKMTVANNVSSEVSSLLQKQDVITQVYEAIQGNLKFDENGSQMLVKLQPENLGTVDLKISSHKGLVLAEIKVENETVKAIVESNLVNLKQALSEKGYQVSQLSVSVDSGKKESQGNFSENKSSDKSIRVKSLSDINDDEDFLAELDYSNDYYGNQNNLKSTIDYFA